MTLGSDSGLRGYAPRELQGAALYRVNAGASHQGLEPVDRSRRSRGLYDSGDAAIAERLSSRRNLRRKSLSPRCWLWSALGPAAVNREVVRPDLGFPLELSVVGRACTHRDFQRSLARPLSSRKNVKNALSDSGSRCFKLREYRRRMKFDSSVAKLATTRKRCEASTGAAIACASGGNLKT